MQLNIWSYGKIFSLSIIFASVATFFLAQFYFELFPYRGGGIADIGSKDFEAYMMTFFFLYVFLQSIFYKAYAHFRLIHFGYFVVVPFLIFLGSSTTFIMGLILIAIGLFWGHLLKLKRLNG